MIGATIGKIGSWSMAFERRQAFGPMVRDAGPAGKPTLPSLSNG